MLSTFRKIYAWLFKKHIFHIVILVLTGGLTFISLIFQITINPSSYQVEIGSVAPLEIHAPRSITYVSQVLTTQAQENAAEKVAPIYLPVDPVIARNQLEQLRIIFGYISIVRTDEYSTRELKIQDLDAIDIIKLSSKTKDSLLDLDNARWDSIQQEASRTLEQIMRNIIRPEQLDEARQNVSTIISFTIPQEQAVIISEIVSQLLIPNSLYSPEQTLASQKKARQSVLPISNSYLAGETIVRQGQVITPDIFEALSQSGLIQTEVNSQNIIASVSIVLLLSGLISLFFSRFKLLSIFGLKSILIVSLTFLTFLYGARFIIPNRTLIPYLFPLPAFGLTIACLYSIEFGLISSLSLGILAAYGIQNSLDLILFYSLTSICGILVLGKGRRIANFIWAGVMIGLTGSAIILAYRLPNSITDWQGLATLIGVALLNGIASASLTLIFQSMFAQILGLTTPLQLMDLSRPDHPLLQYILRNAPGTYQHSLQVANLSEQAAEAIGADSLLLRVGSLYHDAGKALNPGFFIENQIPGKINPHNDLNPIQSAAIIIRHVSDGLSLARKYRLPPRIRDFLPEHHGTLITRYQYNMAINSMGESSSKVDEKLFRYPGPKPSSREAALLMLADGCEARARSEIPKNEDELRVLVRNVFDYCQHEGQLDNTSMSLRDLNIAMTSFVNSLQNIYHPRIRYPELEKSDSTSSLKHDQ